MLGFHHRWLKRPRERKTHSRGSSALSRTLSNLMTQILSTPLSSGSLSSTCELSFNFLCSFLFMFFSFFGLINLFSILGLSFFLNLTLKFGSFEIFHYHFDSGCVLFFFLIWIHVENLFGFDFVSRIWSCLSFARVNNNKFDGSELWIIGCPFDQWVS